MASVLDHLSWKWTFIDVKESAVLQMRRSSSQPAFKGTCLLDNVDPFKHDRAYVTTLEERAWKLTEPSVISSATQQLTSDQGSMFDSLETISNLSKIDTSSQSGEASPRSLREEGFSASSYCLVMSDSFDDRTDNIGSAGHPLFCNRPCIFFPMGQCSSGRSCNHCHEVHIRKWPNLDKINRATLKSIPLMERTNLLLAVINERSELFELPPEKFSSFLHVFKDMFGALPSDAVVPVSTNWKDNRLVRQLLKMPLITLLNLLQDCNDSTGRTSREALNKFRYMFQA
jgi:hypothetical protein